MRLLWKIRKFKFNGSQSATKFNLQCESKKSPLRFSDIFFPNGWEILNQFLHTYYTFLSTLDFKYLFNYLQLWRSYAILSATTQRIFTFR